LRALAVQAPKDEDGLPVIRDALAALPRSLVVWRPHKPGSRASLARALSERERAALSARAAAIEIALEPFGAGEVENVEAQLLAMFSGFRAMKQQGEDAEAMVAITRAVLHDLPAWAITKACLKIARGDAELDKRFSPNDSEIREVALAVVAPYRRALRDANELLEAEVTR